MKTTKEVLVETDRFIFISPAGALTGWCDRCSGHVTMVTTEQVTALGGAGGPGVACWLEAGELHRSVTVEGRSLICFNSLLQIRTSGRLAR